MRRPGYHLLLDGAAAEGTSDAVALAGGERARTHHRVRHTVLPTAPMTVAHRSVSALAVTLSMIEDGHHATHDLVADAREHCAELLAALDLVERGS